MNAPLDLLAGTPPPPLNPLVQALSLLLEGYTYAQDLQASPWEFAVEASVLLQGACTPNTLRWLERRGYAKHGPPNAGKPRERQPRAPGRSSPGGGCFILTEGGVSLARALCPPLALPCPLPALGHPHLQAALDLPVWDPGVGELSFHGRLVKRFRRAASNQRVVLDALQRQGWPEQLGDPLPPPDEGDVNVKQRLHDTIKNLNRDQEARCLRFYGTDSGRAVGWRERA
jgi:hypothetical protein